MRHKISPAYGVLRLGTLHKRSDMTFVPNPMGFAREETSVSKVLR